MDTAMSNMRLENGEPDYQARKVKLREMVLGGALTCDELRLLKQLLLEEVTLQADILSRIPLELVAMVVQNLGLCDLWACYAVSKSWRNRLMADPVASVLAGIHFPSLVQNSRQQIQDGSIGMQFLKTLGKSLRRTEAPARSILAKPFRWHNETVFTIDDPTMYERVQPQPGFKGDLLYSQGRIAWMPEEFTVCVDSLVTMKRKAFSFPEGKLLGLAHRMALAALGSKLLVATMGTMMIAWDLETGQCEHVRLPVLFYNCAVKGDQVVLVAHSHVFIYRYGGALLELPLGSMPSQHRPPPHNKPGRIFRDAVIHHEDENTIFVAALQAGTGKHIVIHEFTDRKWVSSYEHRIHGQTMSIGYLRKANSHGLYALCHSQINSLQEVPAEACHPSRDVLDEQQTICTTYFNIYHRTFSRQYFRTPRLFCTAPIWTWSGCVAALCGGSHPSSIIFHQSSLENRARKTQWETYEVEDEGAYEGNPSSFVAADDSFLVVSNGSFLVTLGF